VSEAESQGCLGPGMGQVLDRRNLRMSWLDMELI
jgi:hypothetical protein